MRQRRFASRSQLIVLAAALLVVACRQDIATDPQSDAVPSAASSNAQAMQFVAQLRPLNPGKSYRPVHGVAVFKLKDDVLTVKVNASGLQPGMAHPQHIHMMDACPTAADDGGDGIINLADGLPSYGGVLAWLDGDLANPGPDFASLPNPENSGGAITFSASASLSALEGALGEPLDLANRSVVLHGVAASTDLSADPVAAANPAVLPVACGPVN